MGVAATGKHWGDIVDINPGPGWYVRGRTLVGRNEWPHLLEENQESTTNLFFKNSCAVAIFKIPSLKILVSGQENS